jgi:hypothetical protein
MTRDRLNPIAEPGNERVGQPAASVAAPEGHPPAAEPTDGLSAKRHRPRARRSIALMRLLGAECPSCRGFGCSACDGTGLG